jgi:uncharacterized lipoprotein YajG
MNLEQPLQAGTKFTSDFERLNTMTRTLISLVIALNLVLAGCNPPSQNQLTVTPETVIPPSGAGPTSFIFKITRNGQPVTNAKVSLENNMTHAGMETATREAQEVGSGVYQAQSLEFEMAGDYVITVTAEKDGEKLTGEYRFGVRK